MMHTSDTTTEIAPALARAFGDIAHAARDAKNAHFRSTYATLASVLDAVRPVYASHGLAVVQSVSLRTTDMGTHVDCATRIVHTSGQWVESSLLMPVDKKASAQAVGSAITYARRYSLQAMCGIASEDDDGNAASQPGPGPIGVTESRVALTEAGLDPDAVASWRTGRGKPPAHRLTKTEHTSMVRWLLNQGKCLANPPTTESER